MKTLFQQKNKQLALGEPTHFLRILRKKYPQQCLTVADSKKFFN